MLRGLMNKVSQHFQISGDRILQKYKMSFTKCLRTEVLNHEAAANLTPILLLKKETISQFWHNFGCLVF